MNLKKELDDRQPKLELMLETTYREFSDSRNETNFMMSGVIANGGAPSIAAGWKAVYKRPNQPDENMTPRYLSQPYIIRGIDGTVSLTNESLLQTRTLNRPLANGDARNGRILFVLPGNHMNETEFTIEVRCTDIKHKVCTAIYTPDLTPIPTIQFYPDEIVTPLPPSTPELLDGEDQALKQGSFDKQV